MTYTNSRIFNEQDFCLADKDYLHLDLPRPLGLSGHLRVRNEALTLRACLDSCLPFLDELIVTYNDSDDATEEILLEYSNAYPDKMRLYWYPLEEGMCRGKMCIRPLGHLAQFCNFGYVKLRYEYYMKIDGDQVYFTDKMLFIREMLFKYHGHGADYYSLQHDQANIYTFYEKIVAKFCLNPKQYALVLGGLNICYNEGELYVYTLENLDEKPLFNGFSGDTCIIRPQSQTRYLLQGDYYEVYPLTNLKCISLGLVWVHTGFIKQAISFEQSNVITLKDAHNFTWDEVYEKINTRPTEDKKTHNMFKNLGRQFWDRDVPTFVTKELYERYFIDILHKLSQK